MRYKHDKEHFQQCNSHTNLVNLVQNTNELYKNVYHHMESKTPQTISHNHIKIIGSKNTKTPRAINFINQFALGHQLAHQNNNLVIIVIKAELQYSKHPKINHNLIL